MKNYEKPMIEVTAIKNDDIITASSNNGLNLSKAKKLTGVGENVIDF